MPWGRGPRPFWSIYYVNLIKFPGGFRTPSNPPSPLDPRMAHALLVFVFYIKKKIIEINKGTTLLQPKAKLTKKNLQKSTMSVRKKSNLFLHLCKEYNVLGSITFEYISGKKRRKSFYLGLSSVLSSSQTIYK